MDFFAILICARTRTFLTIGAGKLDESVPKLFVLTSPGDLTSGSDNVTSVRQELGTAGVTKQFSFRTKARKNKTFPFAAKRTLHGGMNHNIVCQQLSVSRSQLNVWLKRDQLGFGLETQPVAAARRPSFTRQRREYQDGVE